MSEITRGVTGMPFVVAMDSDLDLAGRQLDAVEQGLLAELEKIKADRKACWEEFKVQGRQLDRIKVERDDLEAAMNEILRVTKLGSEAFGIAALVLGELGVSKEAQS